MSEVSPERAVFLEVHADLPRQGPGDRLSTARAIAGCGPLPDKPRILDIACGPGMQTLHLAELVPGAMITAVDRHRPYLERAKERIAAAGLSGRVAFQPGDMRDLPFSEGEFDLIWCEGAAYIMGVEQALGEWRRYLSAAGRLAFTDCVWLTDQIPEALRKWWQAGYADMGDVSTCLQRLTGSGFRALDHFTLPESSWWDDYYVPMEARIGLLRDRYQGSDVALATLDACQMEIDYYRRWSAHYGYLFVVAGIAEGG